MIFNLFATHLNAWSTVPDANARKAQVQDIASFIQALNIPTDGTETVLIQGDFNSDYIKQPIELQTYMQILNANVPSLVGETFYSSDPRTNALVGKDSQDNEFGCVDFYKQSLNESANSVNSGS